MIRDQEGRFFKIVADPACKGRFALRTAFLGNPVGPRLCKSQEPIPSAPTSGLTRDQAKKSIGVWSEYVQRQEED